VLAFCSHVGGAQQTTASPPQDHGLPYTRSSQASALADIRDGITVFAGSRYGYVRGYRVRLDDQDLLHTEAVSREGEVYVPAAFAAVMLSPVVEPPPVPADLASIADRWVYAPNELTVSIAPKPDASIPTIEVDGRPFYSFSALARARGLTVSKHPRGLVFAGSHAKIFPTDQSRLDNLITLFDTPEKFADPDIATRSIPILARQGKWTEHAKATPEQRAILEGPETKWPTAPKSDYDYTGFDARLLGSAPPPPGVYPRVLFSPQDVPFLAARVKSTRVGQKSLIEMEELFKKTWWDPTTSDGQVFKKLYSGDLAGLEWDAAPGTPLSAYPQQFKGQKPGIANSHVAYVPECLTAMALYCLLTEDDTHGRQVAAAVANYFKLREPLLDRWLELSDSEFGSTYVDERGGVVSMGGNGARTHWRNLHGLVPNMNLGLSLDFAGKWMNAEQKDLMRRVIAKATYGRRSYGQDAPVRFRDINWMTWDLPHYLAVTAIEGLSGFDPEAYASGAESVRAFCDWGINASGVIYESNGKTPGGNQFQLLSMIALARRGENLFGHPHFRRLLDGQIHSTSPSGIVTVNSGTQYNPFSRERLNPGFVRELKAFYPDDRRADFLLTLSGEALAADAPAFDPETYRAELATVKKLRLPSITYPGMTRNVLYDADSVVTTRADLGLPLDFNDPGHGVFSSASDDTPDATWIHLIVRPDHYFGAGHHHADAGMFHFSALGVDWFTESPLSQEYSGNYHNLVLVDGLSEPSSFSDRPFGWQGAATYLGAELRPKLAQAAADLTYSYSWRWLAQPQQTWEPEWANLPWEVEPNPENLKIWAGTARYKFRPWWPTYNFTNYLPNLRAPFNPMRRVIRRTGLVRGEHPYGFVLDDVQKDDAVRLYQWTAMLNGGVWRADVPGLAANQLVLAQQPAELQLENATPRAALTPKPGDPLLFICALGLDNSGDPALPLIAAERLEGPKSKKGHVQFYDRVTINRRATSANFRVLLVPFRAGEALPVLRAVPLRPGEFELSVGGQVDTLRFDVSTARQSNLSVIREGQPLSP
jgi:hypothetical protein